MLFANQPKIVLMWVPGHCGVLGNELADRLAKESHDSPLIASLNYNNKDISNFVKPVFKGKEGFMSTSDWYKKTNKDRMTIENYFKNCEKVKRLDMIKVIRLRLGHSLQTHGHLVGLQQEELCSCPCAEKNQLNHILCCCPRSIAVKSSLLPNSDIISLLSNPTNTNILAILNFVKNIKLYYTI